MTTIDLYIELKIDLKGTVVRGYKLTHDDPGMADTVQDIEITGLMAYCLSRGGRNILAGVDLHNPEVVKILDSLRDYVIEAAEEEFLAEAGD